MSSNLVRLLVLTKPVSSLSFYLLSLPYFLWGIILSHLSHCESLVFFLSLWGAAEKEWFKDVNDFTIICHRNYQSGLHFSLLNYYMQLGHCCQILNTKALGRKMPSYGTGETQQKPSVGLLSKSHEASLVPPRHCGSCGSWHITRGWLSHLLLSLSWAPGSPTKGNFPIKTPAGFKRSSQIVRTRT